MTGRQRHRPHDVTFGHAERFRGVGQQGKMIAARRNWTQLEAIMAAKAKDRGEAFSEAESGTYTRLR